MLLRPSAGHFRWRVFIATLVLTLAVVATFWVMVPPTYLTNDDVAIKRDLEGLTTPDAAPTGYVLMAHSLLGWALVWIQRIVPVHQWDIVVAGLLICSIAVLLSHAWSMCHGLADRLLSIFLALAVIAPLLAGMQFTASATLAGIAGMTTIAVELLLARPRPVVLGAAGALVLLGLLVRPMGSTAGALLAIGLLIPAVVGNPEARSTRLRRLCIAAAVVAAASGLLVYGDDALYRLSPEWNAYRQDNWILAWFFEWGGELPANLAEPLRAQVGWSASDWELLRRFWGIDPSIHSHERMELLYRAWSAIATWRLRAAWLFQRAAGELTGATVLRLFVESRLALAVSALAVLAWASWRGVAAAFGSIVIFYGACIAIEVAFKDLPARLFVPMQIGLVVTVLITSRMLSRSTSRLLTALCAAVAVTLAAQQARIVASNAIAEKRQSRETDAQVLELLQQRPSLLLLHSDSFPSEYWWRPFHSPPVRLPAIQLGMNNHNPYVQRFITRSYPEPLLHAICTQPSILVIAERDRLEPVTTFMREHYGTEVEWNETYAGSFRVWRCSAKGH
jgi:hypothetical protein